MCGEEASQLPSLKSKTVEYYNNTNLIFQPIVQVIQASNLSLNEVQERFNLQRVWDNNFFTEWQHNLPEVTNEEKRWLDKVKDDYLSLSSYPLHEEVVKLTVLAPLLSLAGLTRYPFIPIAEKQVEIAFEDEDQLIRGRIDLLILHQQLWAVVVESKAKKIDVLEGLPQALFYMTSKLSARPIFGFLTNGNHSIFLKLQQQETPQFGLSELLTLYRQENDLYEVLAILKQLRDLVQQN